MPRPAEVTEAEIIAAAASLVAVGKAVNGFSLRKALGKGGPDYLARVWNEAQQAAAGQGPADEMRASSPLPSALAEHLEKAREEVIGFLGRLADQTWQVADDIALRRTADEREQARKAIAAAEQELADAKTAIEDADSRASAADEEQGQTAHEFRAAQDAAQILTGRLAAAEDAARQAASAISDLSARLAAATTTAQAATAEADRIRQEIAAVRAEAQATADRAQQANAELTAQLAASNARATAVEAEAGRERKARERAEERLAAGSVRPAEPEPWPPIRLEDDPERTPEEDTALPAGWDDLEAEAREVLERLLPPTLGKPKVPQLRLLQALIDVMERASPQFLQAARRYLVALETEAAAPKAAPRRKGSRSAATTTEPRADRDVRNHHQPESGSGMAACAGRRLQ